MISNIFNNKNLPIYAKGKNSREWIHVRDHCNALYLLFKNGKSGKSYNVGSGKNLRNIDLVKKLIKICNSTNRNKDFIISLIRDEKNAAEARTKARSAAARCTNGLRLGAAVTAAGAEGRGGGRLQGDGRMSEWHIHKQQGELVVVG